MYCGAGLVHKFNLEVQGIENDKLRADFENTNVPQVSADDEALFGVGETVEMNGFELGACQFDGVLLVLERFVGHYVVQHVVKPLVLVHVFRDDFLHVDDV